MSAIDFSNLRDILKLTQGQQIYFVKYLEQSVAQTKLYIYNSKMG